MKRIVGTIVGVLFVLTISVAGICLVSGLPGKGKYPIWNYEKTHREKGNYTVYDFEDVELMLPAEWEGKYGIERFEEHIDFFHSASRNAWEKYGTGEEKTRGVLFSLWCNFNGEYPENSSHHEVLGIGNHGLYYLRFAEDGEGYVESKEGYMENEEVWNEWRQMAAQWIWKRARLQGEEKKEQSGEKRQPGGKPIEVHEFLELERQGGYLAGTILSRTQNETGLYETVVIQTEDGEQLSFDSCEWSHMGSDGPGDLVRLHYLGDLYGAPMIRILKRQSSREELAGEVHSIEGIYDENSDDYLFFYIGSEWVSFMDRRMPEPDNYKKGDRMRIEYLGALRDPWLVRLEKIE